MKTLLMGQKIPFSQLSITDCFEIEFSFSQSSIDPDVSCFCVNSDNQLSDDRYFLFSAQAGQDADVNSVGKTDKDKSIQEVMEEGYADCLYQLRQYFQPAGLAMCTGVFTIQALDEEDYQYELSERELVLA